MKNFAEESGIFRAWRRSSILVEEDGMLRDLLGNEQFSFQERKDHGRIWD